MSAKVTEAHERKAQELWSENSGSAWLQDGVITPKLIPAIAQALADAEAGEREACSLVASQAAADEGVGIQMRSMAITIASAIRARGTPAKEKADG